MVYTMQQLAKTSTFGGAQCLSTRAKHSPTSALGLTRPNRAGDQAIYSFLNISQYFMHFRLGSTIACVYIQLQTWSMHMAYTVVAKVLQSKYYTPGLCIQASSIFEYSRQDDGRSEHSSQVKERVVVVITIQTRVILCVEGNANFRFCSIMRNLHSDLPYTARSTA